VLDNIPSATLSSQPMFSRKGDANDISIATRLRKIVLLIALAVSITTRKFGASTVTASSYLTCSSAHQSLKQERRLS